MEELVGGGHGGYELLLLVGTATIFVGGHELVQDCGTSTTARRDRDTNRAGRVDMGARPSAGTLAGSARRERRVGSSPFWAGC